MVSTLSDRKRAILAHSEQSAAERDKWIEANPGYFEDDRNYMRFLIPEGARVLELGCATGEFLARLKPAHGVGVDLSPGMIAKARAAHPQLELLVGDVEDPEASPVSPIKGRSTTSSSPTRLVCSTISSAPLAICTPYARPKRGW